ncbi:MAG: TatD family hydrolase [Spirochaetaceae bacterium]|nr:TatD family hydrolase [Spirochaetaceae bacterium]
MQSEPVAGCSAPGTAVPGTLTDSHAHLSVVQEVAGTAALQQALDSYAATWQRAPAPASAPFILDIGLDAGDLACRISRFGAYPFIRFSAGIWPGKSAFGSAGSFGSGSSILSLLDADSSNPVCIAIGECGLDYYHMEADQAQQIELFRAQTELAERRNLPLIVHSRLALDDTLAVVSDFASKIPVVIHCFSYDRDAAQHFLEAGCFLSFAGNLSYRKSQDIREALKSVPLERLLLETDSPYMNPEPLRGRPSTSADIVRTLAVAAEIRGIDACLMTRTLNANAAAIFKGCLGQG